MHSAVKMLVARIERLHALLLAMQSGEIPFDHELVRLASGLAKRLPAVDSAQFDRDYATVGGWVACGLCTACV